MYNNKVYSPRKKLVFIELIKDIIFGIKAGNELAIRLFIRDLKSGFEKSLLGYFWIIIPPLVTAGIWIFLTSTNVIKVVDIPMNYSAYCLIGTTIWGVFAESVSKPLQRYKSGMNMMVKLNFPREAFVLASTYDLFFGIFIRFLFLVPLLWVMGYTPGINTLFAFFSIIIVSFIGLSIGLLLTPLGLLFNDVSRLLSMGLPFMMYFSPILYPISGRNILSRLNFLNPVSSWLEFARSLLGGYHYSDYLTMTIWIFISLFFLLLGFIFLNIALPIIVERSGS
jgi:lipopolysaccharide transport system permease protein